MIKNVCVLNSGGEPYYNLIKDNEMNKDYLLASFIQAFIQYSEIQENPLESSTFQKDKTIILPFSNEKNEERQKLLITFQKHHYKQGIINKGEYLYNKFFMYRTPSCVMLEDEELDKKIQYEIGDYRLKSLISRHNKRLVKKSLEQVISKQDKVVTGIALTSSTGRILYRIGISTKNIKNCLTNWDSWRIPPHEECKINIYENINMLCLHTGVFDAQNPSNEILLFCFGESEKSDTKDSSLDIRIMKSYASNAVELLKKSLFSFH
jgi:hypothetical protein